MNNKLDEVAKKLLFNIDERVHNELLNEWNLIQGKLEKLKAYDTKNISPLARIGYRAEIALREDEDFQVIDKQILLANAPAIKDDFILIPRVINNDN